MTGRHQTRTAASLRWYPPAWRERYGAEMAALMEDTLGDRRPTLSFRLSTARAGLRERGHEAGLLGDTPSPAERSRAAALLVLCAWAVFALAGISYAKLSEHFARAMPAGTRALPQGALNAATAAGVTGTLLVLTGAALALPAFWRFIGRGGWTSVRRHVARAAVLSALAVVTLLPLSHWAAHLSDHQRNGGNGWYSIAVMAWALLVAAVVILWTAVGVASARRISMSPRLLRVEAALALAVTGLMAVVTAATALWWAAVASDAPWFLQGTAAGGPGSPFTPNLIVTMALMVPALGVAGYGSMRIVRTWSDSMVSPGPGREPEREPPRPGAT